MIRPSFTIREHAPVATVETLLALSAVASHGPSFSYVFIRGHVFVPRRGKDRPRKSSARVNRLNGRNIERRREKVRFASYFYDWPPHKHSLSYGLFALSKLGFRGALSAIHYPNVSTKRALWDSKESLSSFSLFSLSFSRVDAHASRGLLQMMAPLPYFLRRAENLSCIRVHWTFECLYEDLLREYQRLYVLQISFKFVRAYSML